MKRPRYTVLQIAIHIYAWSALIRLAFDAYMGNLSPNFIQDLEQRTGRHAVTLLVLSLLCTPMNTLFKWSEPIKRRRTLGLYAFMYAAIHVLIFINLDYGLAWSLIAETVLQKPYIVIGAIAFLAMTPLAVTSFDVWKERLGKNWKRLHSLVYFLAPLAVLHYAMSKKGDIFSLQGEIVRPFIYGVVLAVLLIFRIPPVRKFAASSRDRILLLLRRKSVEAETSS